MGAPSPQQIDEAIADGFARNARAGCKLCKPWKANGVRTERLGGERFSDHVRRIASDGLTAVTD